MVYTIFRFDKIKVEVEFMCTLQHICKLKLKTGQHVPELAGRYEVLLPLLLYCLLLLLLLILLLFQIGEK